MSLMAINNTQLSMPGRDELYDLGNDPDKNLNLIDLPNPQTQAKRRELEAKLLAEMQSMNDPELKD